MRWDRWLPVYAVLVAVAYTAAVLRFAWQYSYFVGDDYSTFYSAHAQPFFDALLVPLGGQIVVLHRALTMFTWWLAPMNFAVALAILLAFHLVAVAYLYRTLERLRPSPWNVVIVAFYATHVFFGLNITWFSSGTTRYPYVAFALVAVYHYVRYRDDGRRRDLVVVCAAFLAALGFYSKAILVPFYCAWLDIARVRSPATPRRSPDALGWMVLGGLTLVGLVYAVVARSLLDEASARTNTDVLFQLRFVANAWTVFLNSLAGRVLELLPFRPSPLVFVASAATVVYTIAKVPRLWVAWLVFAGLVSMNFALVGISNRTLYWGGMMVFEYRHYYELCFLVALLAGVVAQHFASRPHDDAERSRSTVRALAATTLGAVLLGAHALLAYAGFFYVEGRYYGDMRLSRTYMKTLQADLAKLTTAGGRPATFVDGPIPTYLDQMGFDFRKLSQLFATMRVDFPFRSRRHAAYAVDQEGHVVRIAK